MRDARKYGETEKVSEPLNPAELYQLFFEEAPDCMMATDHNGQFILVNQNGCKLTGYSREELADMTMKDIINPEDLARGHVCMDDLQPAGNVTMECNILSKDGRLIPVEIIIRPHCDGKSLIIVRDMIDCLHTEMAGKKLQQQLLSIIEFLPDATLTVAKFV